MDTPFCEIGTRPTSVPEVTAGDAGRVPNPDELAKAPGSNVGTAAIERMYGVADAVNVLMLGQKIEDGKLVKQLDIYSGLNGHHIRTIPGERFNSAVLVSGGAGYVVVVDRYGDRDLIRVTDVYGGAGADAFDEDGFPKAGVDWRNTADIMSFAVGSGKTVTGVTVSMHGELLVGLAGATVEGAPATALFYADLSALEAVGMQTNTDLMVATFPASGRLPSQPYTRTRLLLLPASMRYLGEATGSPCFGSARIGETHRWAITSVWDETEQAGAVLVYDTVYRRLVGALGLPDGYQPMSTAHSAQIVSVGLQSVSDAYSQLVVRLLLSDESPFFTGSWKNNIPTADSYDVAATFAVRDGETAPTTKEELLRYLRLSSAINFSEKTSRTDRAALATQVTALPEQWQSATDYGSQEEANLDRVGVNATYETGYYSTIGGSPSLGSVTIPAQVLTLQQPLDGTKTRRIVAGNSTLNTVAEALVATDDDATDTSAPLFLLLHNTHYDWITSGGFTYGCRIGGSLSSAITNSIVPYAVGTMRGIEAGTLKDLPDLRVALIDSETGLFMYRDAKPRGCRMYSGTYASLVSPAGIRTTDCSTYMDNLATDHDGIPRPDKGLMLTYPPEFSASMLDLDRPFEVVRRRVAPDGGVISVQLGQKGWTTRDEDEAVNEVWRLPTWGTYAQGQNVVNYPPSYGPRNNGIWTMNNSAGFFFLDLPKIDTTTGRKLLEDISDVQQQLTQVTAALTEAETDLATLQAQYDAATPTQQPSLARLINAQQAKVDTLTNEKANLTSSLTSLQDQYAAMDEEERSTPIFAVPLALRKRVYKPLDLSSTQDVENNETFDPDSPGGSDGQVVSISDKLIGCVVKPGIRTWVGIEVILDRWEQVEDGVAYWAHPELRENGLGIPVADYVTSISEGFQITGSQVYESGYLASEGALGTWEVDYYADGRKINNSPYKVTYPDQILELAPSDAAGELYGTFSAGRGNAKWERYHKGKVFMFPYDVDVIEVKAKLVNTGFYVYRNGYRTIKRIGGANFVTQQLGGPYTCWQTDPGFYGDTTCESLGCGNVTCASFLFHKNKLYADDPMYKWTRQILWEGSARFSMRPNPYEAAGIAVGKVMNCYWKMDFNANMNRYYVDLRDGKGPRVQ